MAEVARKMNIYEAISRCMEEIGAVGKDAVNKQQGFKLLFRKYWNSRDRREPQIRVRF